ncbi:unnamed protein product [Alternaria alternata]
MVYKYEPLPSARSIRILTLYPAEQYTDAIKCTIEAIELEEASYNALSYSWAMDEDGDYSQNHEIFMNGNRQLITRNLSEGLRRIRVCDEPIRIWIDAVCINQQNDVERSVQVAMMADIYARAEKVLVWLGNGTEEKEDLAMLGLFDRIKQRTEQVEPWKEPGWIHQNCFVLPLLGEDSLLCSGCVAYQQSESGGGDISEHEAHVDWLKECFRSKPPPFTQTAIDRTNMAMRFFSRRYWKRRWILQELSLSNTHHWYWGQHVLDISDFPEKWIEDLVQAIWLVGHGLEETSSDLAITAGRPSPFRTRTKGLSELCSSQNHDIKGKRDWNWLLNDFHSSECSEPKDMYYALASMADLEIRIDYSLTVAQVFQQFAETMLDNGEWIWVFYCAAKTPNNQQSLTMPSWVPDPRLVNFHYGGNEPPMGIQISQGNSLVCDVRCLGVLRTHEEFNGNPDTYRRTHDFHVVWDNLFWQVCSSREPSEEISEVIRPSPLQLQIDSYNRHSGDILCSCLEWLTDRDVWIILRRKDETTQTYELVGVQQSGFALLESVPKEQHEQSFSECPKIKMRIV